VPISPDARGVLYPSRLPTFHRAPVTGAPAAFVRWFWIPEWDIAPGRTSRQHLIGFPACNVVVENVTGRGGHSRMVGIAGPSTRASYRDLTGCGWAVGALLRPAAIPALVPDLTAVRDAYLPVDHPDLLAAVEDGMNSDAPAAERYVRAIQAFIDWLTARLGVPSEEGLLANQIVEVAETNPGILTVTDLARHLDISVRTLQRLAVRYVGLPPATLIRRRRIQEAAERCRHNPGLDLAALAHELGYADHAHLTRDFRNILGFTPSNYRQTTPAQ
jgi:AraC-like DNA-binding protein